MKTIYIDSDCKCHLTNDGTMTAIETEFFDGKCDAFVEGYRYIPVDNIWVREDGVVFTGPMIAPWMNHKLLSEFQQRYEIELLKVENAQLKEESALLNEELISTQLALCDVYEMLVSAK